ncbi:MAG: PCMD domain-containing protein [Prevotella sp.]|nr:PCMD domain-containing protein [Prevotella sp.]
MKKIYTFMMAAFAAMTAWATDYNEPIVVTVNGESSEQTGVISIVQNGENYDLTMKNFMLQSADGPMGVGNVALTGIVPQTVGDVTLLKTSAIVTITKGDDPEVQLWMAEMLPPVPVELNGKIENGHLRCYINIDMMENLGQVIQVAIGKGYQMANQSFENWHTSSGNYVEPNAWHSFESATGGFAAMAGHHIEKSADAHSGEASARINATKVLGIVANGTMTTGRMNAGSMSASNTANHAYIDLSKSDVDGNGDPFYTPLYSRPDSIAVWVKFKQGTANAAHPYATVSAVIISGDGRYQDPEDQTYTNVVAKAKNNTIADTNGEWVRVSAPFAYTENTEDPKAILVTISTNADAGQGSNNDEVLVDDIALIYNAKLTKLELFGESVPSFDADVKEYSIDAGDKGLTLNNIVAEADGVSALVTKSIEETATGYKATVSVYGGDMETATDYVVNVKSSKPTVIEHLPAAAPVKDNAIYNLQGQQVKKAVKGLYIINGKKVVLK